MADTQVYKAQLTFEHKGLESATKLVKGLSLAAKELTSSLKGISGSTKSLEQVATKTQQVSRTQVKSSKEVADAMKRQQEAINHATDIENIDKLVGQFHAVKNAGESTATTLSNRFRGLQLVVGNSGARMQGFREIVAGTSASNNSLVKSLDWVIGRTDKLGRLNNRLGENIVDIAQSTDRLVRSMNSQVDVMKKVASAEGLGTDVAEEFDKSLTRVDSAFKQVITTARGGGDVGKALLRARTEVEGLEFEYQSLVKSGLIPANSETAKLFQEMVQQAKSGSTSLQALSSRYGALKDKIDKTKASQAKQAATGEKQAGIFKRLSSSISGMFGAFRSGTPAINQTNQALDRTANQMNIVSKTANVAKSAFLGAFGGAVVTSLLYSFQDALRGIGREFFELNDLIQNTEITIAGMLEGSQINAESAIAGFTSFVEDQVAQTPFEFSDAIEASLRLVQQGFDPQAWFRPAANAAAAMNKPMEQFIGGMTKLVSGAKGAAVDMFRDFGLNVNNISGLVDDGTGKMVEMSWEFNKQGSLVNDTGEALAILNAYLNQNATFAKAASARSESLSGVVSNMKDAFSKLLIAIGQPIFDKLTVSATGLLSKIDAIMPTAISMATGLGQALSTGIGFVFNLFSNLNGIFSRMQTTFSGFITFVQSAIQGDWTSAWSFLLQAVASSMDGVFSFLNEFVVNAFDWGVSFVSQIANGVFEAANTILMEAVNYVGELISSFMEPGSPPKEGPLSNIDKWGAGLMKTFGSSFSSADVGFINDALSPIADRFAEFNSKSEGLIPFQAIKKNLIGISGELKRTGELNEQSFARMKKQILAAGKGEKEVERSLVAQLEARLRLQATSEKKLKLEEEYKKKIAEAEASGYIPAELLNERDQALAKLDEEASGYEEQIKLQDELTELREMDSKVWTEGQKNAAAAMAANAGMAGSAAKAAKKIKKTWQQTYSDNLAALEQKYNLGLISEEEYLKELLRLEEKWVDDALKNGVTAGIDEHATKIKEIKARLEDITPSKKGAEAVGELFKPPSVEEIFANFIDDAPAVIGDVAQEGGQKFVAAIKTEVSSGIGETLNTIKQKLSGGFGKILQSLGSKFKEFVTPQNLPVIASLVGFLTWLAGPSILGGLGSLVGILTTFGGTIAKLLLTFGKFSAIGFVITAIILNWDKIVAAAVVVWGWLSDVFDDFLERIGGIEKAKELFNGFIDGAKNAGGAIGGAFLDAMRAIFVDLDFGSAWQSVKKGFASVDWSGLLAGAGALLKPLFDSILNGIKNLGQQLLNLLPPQVVQNINNATQGLRDFFTEGRLGGELIRLFQQLGSVMQTLWPAIKVALAIIGVVIGIVINVIASLVVAIMDALPFIERALAGIVRLVTGIIEVFEGFVILSQAAWAAITGDSDKASQLLQQGLGKLQTGIADIFKGIYQTIINVFFAIGQAAISFVTTFIGNILAFVPGMQDASAAFYDFKNVIKLALVELSDSLQQTLYTAVDQAIDILVSLVDQVITIISTLYSQLSAPMQAIIDAIINPFMIIYNLLVGNSIIPDLVNDIITYISLLPSKLLELGGKIAKSLIDGVKGGIGGGVGSLLGGLFGGGEGEGETNKFSGMMAGGQALNESLKLSFNEIDSLWGTVVKNMSTVFSEFLFNITGLNMDFNEYYIVFMNTVSLLWTTFLLTFTARWGRTIVELTAKFQVFIAFILSSLQLVINKFQELIDKMKEIEGALESLSEASLTAFDELTNNADEAARKLESGLLPVLKQAIAYLEQIRIKAEEAMDAAGSAPGVNAGDSGGSIPSAQEGAFRTTAGLWNLHEDEMVLPKKLAGPMRIFMKSLSGLHLGGITKFPAMAYNNSVASRMARFVDNAGSTKNVEVTQHFHQEFKRESDISRFNKKVIKSTNMALDVKG